MEREQALKRLEDLKRQHRELDRKATELASRLFLTQEEEEELARLKKEKLSLKDEIFRLATQLGVDI